MSDMMASTVNFFRLRTIALNAANKSPVMAALAGRSLFALAAVTLILNLTNVILGSDNTAFVIAFNLGTSVFSFIVAWALIGAAKEVHCRRHGLPVHRW